MLDLIYAEIQKTADLHQPRRRYRAVRFPTTDRRVLDAKKGGQFPNPSGIFNNGLHIHKSDYPTCAAIMSRRNVRSTDAPSLFYHANHIIPLRGISIIIFLICRII